MWGLAGFLRDFYTGSFAAGSSKTYQLGVRQRAAIMSVCTLLALIFLTVYGVISLTDPDLRWYAAIQLFAFIVLIINIPIARKTGNIRLASNIMVSLGLPVLLPWVVTGGPLDQGFYWTPVYIVWVFLLVGWRWAAGWLSTYLSIAAILVWLGEAGAYHVEYTWQEFAQILFMSGITFALLYTYEKQSSFFENLSSKALDALEKEKKR